MKIGIITSNYPTKDGLGGYFFVEQLVRQFAKLGHHCYVIAPVNIASKYLVHKPYGCYYEHHQMEGGGFINVYRPRYYGRDIRIHGVSWSYYRCQKSIERVIKKHSIQAEVFYGHFFKSAAVVWHYAKMKNIPLFVATGESTIPPVVKPCFSFTLESFQQYISGVLCVSTKNRDEAIKLKYATPSQCTVIPNGVDFSHFKPMDRIACRQKLGLPINMFIIASVGNYSERKGQSRVVNALDKLNNSSIGVVLIGRGNEILKSKHILFKGFMNHDDVPLYLNAADAYVLPTRWEGCCNSIVEAMACGLPIISSDRSFNWDILNQDNSILIDPDSEEQIANAILKIFNDNELRQKLSNRALDRSRSLSIKERAKNILKFIEERIITI